MSDSVHIVNDIDIVDLTIEVKLTSILFNILQNSSYQIFKVKLNFFNLFIKKEQTFSLENIK